MPKILHYQDDCIGCGSCPLYAPNYWELNDSLGKAVLKKGQLKGKTHVQAIIEEDVEENVDAAIHCPVSCIHVVDDSGKEVS